MDFKVTINDDKVKEFIKDVMGNMPEHSISLRCREWDYENCKYVFYDDEEDISYTINLSDLIKGFKILVQSVLNGKYSFYGVDNILTLDGCDWDACIIDALVQCSIFKEVIYG